MALENAGLAFLADKLDCEDIWSQRLSGGEQQRLALARALLARPDWLFLDESTSAVDEKLEADLYRRLAEQLPDATIVSMGHRSTLHPLHDRHMEMTLTDAGLFSPRERQPACHGMVATGEQDAEDCRLIRVAT